MSAENAVCIITGERVDIEDNTKEYVLDSMLSFTDLSVNNWLL